jgi:hypothetical protein
MVLLSGEDMVLGFEVCGVCFVKMEVSLSVVRLQEITVLVIVCS